MTDQELQRLLSDNLAPPPLGDDAEIEALLDSQATDPDKAYGQGMLARANQPPKKTNRYLAIAALVFLAAIPVAIIAIASQPSGGGDGITGNPAPSEGERLVEIAPEFPEPAFHSTPLDIPIPHLESGQSARLTFTAPEGVHLISHGATVSSKSKPLIGGLAMVTDGAKLGDDSHFVELPPGPQWVQIDLGEPHKIFAITLWHYHKKMRAYRDVVIEISPDESFSSGNTIVFNSDRDNSLGLGIGEDPAYIETNHGRIIDVNAITARYIRLHSNGNSTDDLNHYTEVEVYGIEL